MDFNDASVLEIRDYIKTNKHPSQLTTNKRHIIVRCPYCGDSVKNRNHGHFYIELKPPFQWYCQRCYLGSPVMTTKTMTDLDLTHPDINVNIVKLNKKFKGKFNPKHKFNSKSNIKLNKNNREYDQFKYDYFNSRFGLNLSREEINDKYKVVTSFLEFKDLNKLYLDSYGTQIINTLDKDYIGFLSTDGTHLVNRDVTGHHEKRYHNFKIDENNPFGHKFYTIKTDLDIMSEKIKIVMTEGVFDIIGVYNHIYGGISPNTSTVFAAAAGKGYPQVIEHFMNLGFLDIDIEIYSDQDLKENFFKKLKKNNILMRDKKITLHYNTLDKDYGVTKDKISLRTLRI